MENQSTKKFIVITSIFDPTEAVLAFAKMKEYTLVVVGDKKSPADWHCDNVVYLSVEQQNAMGYALNEALPYNHYSRKMLGYLYAIQQGAEIIVDTDDDNIPKDNWVFPEFEGEFDLLAGGLGFVNVYQLYTDKKIWARGLPLRLINKTFELEKDISKATCKVGLWQGLADEDPDVDAIYRLTSDEPCYFNNRAPLVLDKGTISPFNTQNTAICKELYPLMYLPTFVTFRFTDILRGLVAQPLMWHYGYQLGFLDATVVQKRNPHDYFKDFISEIPMYQHTEKVIELCNESIVDGLSLSENLYKIYEALCAHGIVEERELATLKVWLEELKN
jgi:hypothetical protein